MQRHRLAPFVIGLLLLSVSALGGCASLRGSAQPVLPKNSASALAAKYPKDTALAAFYSADDKTRQNLDKRGWRDMIAGIYMDAADERYIQFRASLSREMKGSAFGLDLGVLVMNGVAAVSGKEAANALAATSATLVGTQGALSKDVYFEKSLSALFSAMDANRTQIKTSIRSNLTDKSAAQYTLNDAFNELRDYESASDINAALSRLTTVAAADAAKEQSRYQALFEVPLVAPAVEARQLKLKAYLDDRLAAQDKTTLDAIATALGVPDPGLRHEYNNIRVVLNAANDDQALDALAAKLKPAVPQLVF